MSEPIEIRPADIIKRPLEVATKTAPGGFNIASIKGYAKDIKELIELAKEMGLDAKLPGLGNILSLGKKPEAAPPPPPAGRQILAFIKILQVKYGDVTIVEALDRLRADYGGWRLSDIIGGKLI